MKSQTQHSKEVTRNAKRGKKENVPNMKRMRKENETRKEKKNLDVTEIALGIRFVTPSKIYKNSQKCAKTTVGKNPGEFVMSPARTRYRIPDKLKIQGKGKRTLKSAKIAEMRQNCRGQTRANL